MKATLLPPQTPQHLPPDLRFGLAKPRLSGLLMRLRCARLHSPRRAVGDAPVGRPRKAQNAAGIAFPGAGGNTLGRVTRAPPGETGDPAGPRAPGGRVSSVGVPGPEGPPRTRSRPSQPPSTRGGRFCSSTLRWRVWSCAGRGWRLPRPLRWSVTKGGRRGPGVPVPPLVPGRL